MAAQSDQRPLHIGSVIFDVEYFEFMVCHSPPAAPDFVALTDPWLTARAMKKVAPLSTSAFAQMRPPCFFFGSTLLRLQH
jgi:hypothetical protein